MHFRCEQGLNLRGEPPIGFQIQRLNLSAITAPPPHLHLLACGERCLLPAPTALVLLEIITCQTTPYSEVTSLVNTINSRWRDHCVWTVRSFSQVRFHSRLTALVSYPMDSISVQTARGASPEQVVFETGDHHVQKHSLLSNHFSGVCERKVFYF